MHVYAWLLHRFTWHIGKKAGIPSPSLQRVMMEEKTHQTDWPDSQKQRDLNFSLAHTHPKAKDTPAVRREKAPLHRHTLNTVPACTVIPALMLRQENSLGFMSSVGYRARPWSLKQTLGSFCVSLWETRVCVMRWQFLLASFRGRRTTVLFLSGPFL